jgi:hypothetical protein
MKLTSQQTDKVSIRLLKLNNTFLLLVLICLLLSTFLNNWRNLTLPIAWNISDRQVNRFEIKAVTIDSNGSPWLIAQKLFRDSEGYELRHITENEVDIWDLPSLTYEEMMSISVAKDKTDTPWLLIGERLAHWNGTEWVFSPTPLNASIHDFLSSSTVIQDSIAWGVDYATEGKRIIRLDLGQEPIQAREILLPDGLDTQKYAFESIVSIGDNDLLAVVSNDMQLDMYRLQNFEWRKITSFQKDQASKLYIQDMVVDSNDRIWVVVNPWVKSDGKLVGKYDPKDNIWTWFDIEPQSDVANRFFDYGFIGVDDLGRVWLSAVQYGPDGSRAALFGSSNSDLLGYETDTLGVYEENSENKLVEIRHYTSKNSYLETRRVSRLILGSDEKIWTWGKQLVWMDSRQQLLPKPLPNRFVALTTKYRMIISLLSLAFLIIVFAIQWQIRRQRLVR